MQFSLYPLPQADAAEAGESVYSLPVLVLHWTSAGRTVRSGSPGGYAGLPGWGTCCRTGHVWLLYSRAAAPEQYRRTHCRNDFQTQHCLHCCRAYLASHRAYYHAALSPNYHSAVLARLHPVLYSSHWERDCLPHRLFRCHHTARCGTNRPLNFRADFFLHLYRCLTYCCRNPYLRSVCQPLPLASSG